VAVCNGCQSCAHIGVRVDGVQLAGFNDRGHAGPGAATLIMTRKERVFAVEGYGADGVFDRVGVHLDTAISQEDLQAIPVPMDVGELLAKAGFGGDTAALLGQPEAEVSNQRGRLFLAGGEALFRCSPSDTGLDLI